MFRLASQFFGEALAHLVVQKKRLGNRPGGTQIVLEFASESFLMAVFVLALCAEVEPLFGNRIR